MKSLFYNLLVVGMVIIALIGSVVYQDLSRVGALVALCAASLAAVALVSYSIGKEWNNVFVSAVIHLSNFALCGARFYGALGQHGLWDLPIVAAWVVLPFIIVGISVFGIVLYFLRRRANA